MRRLDAHSREYAFSVRVPLNGSLPEREPNRRQPVPAAFQSVHGHSRGSWDQPMGAT